MNLFGVPQKRDEFEPVVVHLVGAGATGSYLAHNIAKLNKMLLATGDPGIMMIIYDDDVYENHNVGRQNIGVRMVGRNKALVLSQQINMQYGITTMGIPKRVKTYQSIHNQFHNRLEYLISCVDSVASRKSICETLANPNIDAWIDTGVSKNSCNVFLAYNKKWNKKYKTNLTFDHLISQFDMIENNDNDIVSCSSIQSINQQGYFNNQYVALLAVEMFKDLLLKKKINYSAIVMDIENTSIKKM
jgi:PRTRC genetic system ThiF family protein